MIKRPLCAAALAWAAVLWLLGRLGLPFFSFAPPSLAEGAKQEEAVVAGTVYKKEIYSYSSNLYLKHADLFSNSKIYSIEPIKVHISKTDLKEEISVGDRITVRGSLEQIPEPGNPGQFNERSYYYARQVKWFLEGEEAKLQKERSSWFLWLQEELKEKMRRGIASSFSSKHQGMIEAMLLGDKSGVLREDKLLFQMMGISHILAISGLHLSVLGWGLFGLLRRCGLSVKAGGLLAGAAMLFYGEMTGSGASVTRAAVMFLAALGALVFRRTYDMLSALSLSAILLLGENPLYLYDSSFLLSFGAVLGLGAVFPVLFPKRKKREGKSRREKAKRAVLENLKGSLSVWSVLLPLVMYFFFELPLWGMAANLLALPTVELLLLSGLLAGGLGLLPWGFLGKAAGLPGALILELYEGAGKLIGSFPRSVWITGQPSLQACAAYYVCLFLFLFFLERGRRKREGEKRKTGKKRRGPGISWGILGLGLGILFFRPPIKGLRLTFLDVGQGDCACVQTEESCYLIDGGSSDVSKAGTYRILPFLKSQGIARLDGIFLSHMDEDHVNGVEELLEGIRRRETSVRVKCLFLSPCRETGEKLQELETLGDEAGAEVFYLERGDEIRDRELKIDCLAPAGEEMESNEGSQVLRLELGEFRALFTGDVEGEGEENLISLLKAEGKEYQVLKVAHHGSRNSTPEEFLELVRPEAAVISCGEDNSYGHPHEELLKRLEESGSLVFQTPQRGAIFLSSQGENLQASFQRKGIMIE